MSDDQVVMARWLLFCAVVLFTAEYLTRRMLPAGSERRYWLLALVWVVVVSMLMWGMGDR